MNEIDDEEVKDMIKKDSKLDENLTEGKQFSIMSGSHELEDAEEFLDSDSDETSIEVIDVDADTEDHLKTKEDYVGQAIIRCNRCMSNRFINLEELKASEDDPEVYNVEDECPHCHITGEGFELIGQVGKVATEKPEPVAEPEATDVEETPADEELPPLEAEAEEETTDEEVDTEAEEDAEIAELKATSDDTTDGEVKFDNDEETTEETEDEEVTDVENLEDDEEEELPPLDDEEDDVKESLHESIGKDSIDIKFEDPDWVIVEIKDIESWNDMAKLTRWIVPEEMPDDVRAFVYGDKHTGEKFLVKVSGDNIDIVDRNNTALDTLDPFAAPDIKDIINQPIEEKVQMNKFAKEAWLMNKVISSMNDEDAYYSGWLYIWPDGETEEDCAYDFADEESLEDLRSSFISHYRACHEGDLYDADDETVEYAHKIDAQLGLRPIGNIKPKERKVDEALDTQVSGDILGVITRPENIKKIVVTDVQESGDRELFEGVFEDLPLNIRGSKCTGFDVADGFLTCNIDTSNVDNNRPLSTVLDKFTDDKTEKITLWDEDAGDEVFTGTKEDALNKFGNTKLISIEAPAVIRLTLNAPEILSQDEIDDVTKEDTELDTLVKKVIAANNLSEYKINNSATNEYWINRCIKESDDLNIIYEKFVGNLENKELIREFKKLTGYRTSFDEALEKEFGKDVVTDDGLDKLIHNIESTDDEYVDPATDEPDPEMTKELEEPELDGADVLLHNVNSADDEYIDPATGEESDVMTNSELENESLDEKLGENKLTESLINEGVSSEAVSIVSGLLEDEWEAVKGYEDAAAKLDALGIEDKEKVLHVLSHISEEEAIHVGQLEQIVKILNPEYEAKQAEGHEEGAEELAGEDPHEDTHEEVEPEDHEEETEEIEIDFEESLNESADDEYKKALKKALTQLKKPGVFAVIVGYDQGKGMTYLDTPLVKKSQEELQAFADGFRRGREGTKVVVRAVYPRNIEDIEALLAESLTEDVEPTDQDAVEAIDVIKDKLDVHGEDNEVTFAEKGELDNEEAPKVTVDVTDDEFETLEKEFHEEEPTEDVEEVKVDDTPDEESAVEDEAEAEHPVDEASIRSFKTRKELSEAIEEYKNNSTPYTVRRSVKEGFRYDLIEEVKCDHCECEHCDHEEAEPESVPNTEIEPTVEDVEVVFDEDQFDNDINEYFDSAYEETILYKTESGSVNDNGEIVLEGLLMTEEIEKPVTFTLTSTDKNLKESLNLEEDVKNATYRVSNNISEEVFEFKFNRE